MELSTNLNIYERTSIDTSALEEEEHFANVAIPR